MVIHQSTRGSNMDYAGQTVDGPGLSPHRSPGERIPTESLAEESNGNAEMRKIRLNSMQETPFTSNHIMTAKYTIISFVPKFLFEQFRRYANVFFLCIGLLQQIPNVSPTGRYVTIVPFGIILVLTAIKELIEDWKRHQADAKVNNSSCPVLDPATKSWEQRTWKAIQVGDIVRIENGKFFPADLLLLSSSEPQGMCYVETSNLDGETNLKIRSAISATSDCVTPYRISDLRGEIVCDVPNRNLYEFKGNYQSGSDEAVALNQVSVLLRGAKLMNTPWAFGMVVYTGHETKLLMNSTKAPLKFSNIDKIKNHQIIFLFFILIAISLLSAGFNELQKSYGEDHTYLGSLSAASFFYNFLTFFILYNNLIPISLQVTLEFVKFTQAYFINWDQDMYYEPSGMPALARTSNINEELGQIKYVFSDKTGTLTRNIMEFKRCSVAGKVYSSDNAALLVEGMQHSGHLGGSEAKSSIVSREDAANLEHFLVLMAVCHTVIPEQKSDDELFYNASSPDEKALVEGAATLGYKFLVRMPESVVISNPVGQRSEYQVLHVIEFNSDRKRMSVVVRDPKGRIKLMIKGADTMIMSRLGEAREQRQYHGKTLAHLEDFAREGLRTLCLAMREIDEAEYQNWSQIYHAATTNLVNKDEECAKAADLLEIDLTLLGATAIEDKLQDGVPETIAQLLEAHIHVWVLTGDKQETAINIGYSCRLLKPEMPIIIINTNNLDETRAEIMEHVNSFREDGALGNDNDVAVVVDGQSLLFALDHSLRKDFIDLCCSCKSVICCRVSPMQKAEMVQLVQESEGAISLAIGDGANDVAMIQKADVGVGISGNEGLQAANSSDFAIAQFRYLAKLLFVHGAWNYTRISKVIVYSFYKNICLYIIELWFAFFNFWSGQVLFERWTIGMYNIFFTSFPPIAMGLFDQYCNARTRMKHPSLYLATQRSEYFNHRIFWLWIANSIVHSAFLFALPMASYHTGIVWGSGRTGDYLVIGNMVYTFVVVTVCLKAGLEMDSWSWISHLSIWGSILFWLIFLVLYSFFWPVGLPVAANMAGMVTLLFSSPVFWLGLLLIPFVTLLPDVTYKAIQISVWPTETDRIRLTEISRSQKEVDAYIESGENTAARPANEASSLLRNVRRVFRRKTSSTSSSRRRQTPPDAGGAPPPNTGSDDAVIEELELHGYAFSQEEDGAVSQVEFIRRKCILETAQEEKQSNHLPKPTTKRSTNRNLAITEEETIPLNSQKKHLIETEATLKQRANPMWTNV